MRKLFGRFQKCSYFCIVNSRDKNGNNKDNTGNVEKLFNDISVVALKQTVQQP